MVYAYTPTYYSTLHDSITSICKTILPFSFKKRCLTSTDQKLSKLQSDNLKWQQDSFHQMLNLMGLHKEGILAENEVSTFRTHLLETLIASPLQHEQPVILRDKLLFLQELLYAKCISEEEYHSSKRPLLQRLAIQGAEIEARDVIVGGPKENSEEEWSVIDLKDEQCLMNKENSNSKNKSKHGSAMKQIKGAASMLNFVSNYKPGKNRVEKSIFDSPSVHTNWAESKASGKHELMNSRENPFWMDKENEAGSILMPESLPPKPKKGSDGTEKAEKFKRKPFKNLFQKDQREGSGCPDSEERAGRSGKRQWGFDGFMKWKKSESEDDETIHLPLNERSDSEAYLGSSHLTRPISEEPDTRLIKRMLHSEGSPSDFFIDKVLGEKIKKELLRIQTELETTNPNMKLSNDQIEAISTKLPVDKTELKNYFPESWCNRFGDVLLGVVKKEFKDHVGEMENMRNNSRKKCSTSSQWTTFEDENCHPNLFGKRDNPFLSSGINPFSRDYREQ